MAAASSQAYDMIWQKISEGGFQSGDRLKEPELVDLCRVSRTPVREALRRLERDGLVEIKPNLGAVVAEWRSEDLVDLYQMRARIEGFGARLAALRRDETDLDKLDSAAQAMWALAKTELSAQVRREIAKLNSQYHHDIALAAKSRAALAASSQVIEAPVMLRTFFQYNDQELRRSLSDHLAINTAIREQNEDLAEALMQAHILSGLRALTQA